MRQRRDKWGQVPLVRQTWVCAGRSGWGGGYGGGGVEWVDRGLADEEAEDIAERVAGYVQPVPAGFGIAVLFFFECLAAAGFFAHQLVDGVAAAEPVHDVEQGAPEAGVAEAKDDGEIEGDGEEDAAHGLAADLTLEFLQGGHVQFGIVPEGGAGCAGGVPAPRQGFGGLWLRCGHRARGFGGVGRAGFRQQRYRGVALDEGDVAAGGGAGEEDTLQCKAAEDAAVEVGEDGGDVGGAEIGGDGAEAGGGGARAEGVDEVAAVVEEDAGDLEEALDVGRQSGGGGILRGIRLRGGGGRGGLHWGWFYGVGERVGKENTLRNGKIVIQVADA